MKAALGVLEGNGDRSGGPEGKWGVLKGKWGILKANGGYFESPEGKWVLPWGF